MKSYRILSVDPTGYPVVHIVFEDGLSGDVDLIREIDEQPLFAPLRDRELFDRVAVGIRGRSIGWNLDQIGREIDLDADHIRIDLETQKVHQLAERFRHQRAAAE